MSQSDVYWDKIESIELVGEEEVYDLTVDGLHSFVANEIVVHNSIEQDSDVVCFLFRQEYYEDEPDEETKGKAEVIVAKHRNGPIGSVELAFQAPYPRFRNMARGYRGADAPPAPRASPPDDFDVDDPIADAADEF